MREFGDNKVVRDLFMKVATDCSSIQSSILVCIAMFV